jgi:lysophospholipase L1-like esterase
VNNSNKIEQVDKNFKQKSSSSIPLISIDILDALNSENTPFQLSGFPWFTETKKFTRLSKNGENINLSLAYLSRQTSGGLLRFKTDSSTINLEAVLNEEVNMSHMPRSGSSGFDLYIDSVFSANLKAEALDLSLISGNFFNNFSKKIRECSIYFPLYNGVNKLIIRIAEDSKIFIPSPFKIINPILFYGSSITQGGCASRPGNSYTNIVARRLSANSINLGFSGNAKGETEIANEIASIKMSAFVYDYDHNAPTVEHLRETHEIFFQTIRKADKKLPIFIISRPDYNENNPFTTGTRNIIKQTYLNAIRNNDKHVYFIDGKQLFGRTERDMCTVDGCHPNDLGFLRMANIITKKIQQVLC